MGVLIDVSVRYCRFLIDHGSAALVKLRRESERFLDTVYGNNFHSFHASVHCKPCSFFVCGFLSINRCRSGHRLQEVIITRSALSFMYNLQLNHKNIGGMSYPSQTKQCRFSIIFRICHLQLVDHGLISGVHSCLSKLSF